MRLTTYSLITIVVGSVCLVGGCATQREDFSTASRELKWRSGHTLTNARPGEVVIPSSISFEDGLSEDEAVALALWNNSSFQETLADLGLSRADLVQAGMLPNPTLSMLFPVGAKPFELTARYPIEALWLRPRRVAAAKLDYQRTEQRLIQSALDLIRDVRVACADLTLANERLLLVEATARTAKAIAGQAQARLSAGEATELEVIAARSEALQAGEQATRATPEARLARERLRFLVGLGVEHWPAVTLSSPLPSSNLPEASLLVTNALASRPDIRSAELGLEAAGKRLGLAKAELYTFSLALNAKDVGADFLSGPGLDIPIPIANQNQGGIAQARAKFEKAARQYLTVRDRIVLEVRDAHTRLLQARDSHHLWQQEILPPLEQSVAAAGNAFAAGNVTQLVVLEGERKLADARLRSAAAAADVRRASAELERSVGLKLDFLSTSPAAISHEAK